MQKFKSHCAPDSAADLPPAQLTVAELKSKLESLGQSIKGKKAELVERLMQALAQSVKSEEKTVPHVPKAELAAAATEGCLCLFQRLHVDLHACLSAVLRLRGFEVCTHIVALLCFQRHRMT